MLGTIESSDEEPETTTAAPAVATTVAATSGAADDCSTIAAVHHVKWRMASSTKPSLNGNFTPRMWSVKNVLGENLYPGALNAATNGRSALDFFLLMFPPKQLVVMVDLTNIELVKLEANTINTSELLKFFGVLILMTSFEFTSRASLLWSSVAPMKCKAAPHFGLTRMPKHCFNDLFCALQWSKQPSERAENESTQQHWWKLVDDFIANLLQFMSTEQISLFLPKQFVSTNP